MVPVLAAVAFIDEVVRSISRSQTESVKLGGERGTYREAAQGLVIVVPSAAGLVRCFP